MSNKKPLLQTVLDKLDQKFDELELSWNIGSLDDKDKLLEVQNQIVPLLSILHDADLGENITETQERLRRMCRPGTDWSAVSVKALVVLNGLEKK
jgi:hypothetical protein